MWEIVHTQGGIYYRHVEHPEYEIHDGTSSRFELHNTRTNACVPLFTNEPNANIHTVMDTVGEAIRSHKFLTKIEEEGL